MKQKNATITVNGQQFLVLKTGKVLARKGDVYLNKLTIYDAQQSDSGMYVCVGANSMGHSVRSAFLTVLPGEASGRHTTAQLDVIVSIWQCYQLTQLDVMPLVHMAVLLDEQLDVIPLVPCTIKQCFQVQLLDAYHYSIRRPTISSFYHKAVLSDDANRRHTIIQLDVILLGPI